MKKILFLIAFLASVVCVNAQLVPVRKIGASKVIETARMKMVQLVKLPSSYALFILATGNQFDEPATFFLGEDKESAISSLSDMLGLCDSLGDKESLAVMNMEKEVVITKREKGGNVGLFFNIPGIAGHNTCVTKRELTKLYEALLKYNE